jgi:hypothetical protein
MIEAMQAQSEQVPFVAWGGRTGVAWKGCRRRLQAERLGQLRQNSGTPCSTSPVQQTATAGCEPDLSSRTDHVSIHTDELVRHHIPHDQGRAPSKRIVVKPRCQATLLAVERRAHPTSRSSSKSPNRRSPSCCPRRTRHSSFFENALVNRTNRRMDIRIVTGNVACPSHHGVLRSSAVHSAQPAW